MGGQGAGGGGNRIEGVRKKDMSAIMLGRYCWRDSASSSASLAALTRHLQYNAQRLRTLKLDCGAGAADGQGTSVKHNIRKEITMSVLRRRQPQDHTKHQAEVQEHGKRNEEL
jgi:hypothetical protein